MDGIKPAEPVLITSESNGTENHNGDQVKSPDYDANGPDELSLLAHEVLNVYELDPESEDFLVAERGTKVGKIPRAYVKIIS